MICLKLFIKNNGKSNNKVNNMTKEIKKADTKKENLMLDLKSNEALKNTLNLALKNTSNLMNVLLPKIADAIKDVVLEYKKATEKNTKTSDSEKAIQTKALREHSYDLVGYVRTNGINHAFEMVVTRAIKLGLMLVDHPKEFQVDTKNSKVFVMSKIATPFIVEKLDGQKANSKKKENTSTELVEVNTGVVDRAYKVKYAVPTRASRKPQTQDSNMTFGQISNQFFSQFNKALDYATKKDVRFFDMVDEKTMETLANINAMFNSQAYKGMRDFSIDYEIDINGDLKKAS